MASYDYEYFCGANIFILVDDQPLLEAAGISYMEQDSKQPIYGYSSRLFDAVAPGQKIIQGTLVVNQVHPDYLFESIKSGRGSSEVPLPPTPSVAFGEGGNTIGVDMPQGFPPGSLAAVWRQGITGEGPGLAQTGYSSMDWGAFGSYRDMADELKQAHWAEDVPSTRRYHTDLTLLGPTNIRIEFANQFTIELDSCFFVSRSSGIQIDENVILEEYGFFARNLSVGDVGL